MFVQRKTTRHEKLDTSDMRTGNQCHTFVFTVSIRAETPEQTALTRRLIRVYIVYNSSSSIY